MKYKVPNRNTLREISIEISKACQPIQDIDDCQSYEDYSWKIQQILERHIIIEDN